MSNFFVTIGTMAIAAVHIIIIIVLVSIKKTSNKVIRYVDLKGLNDDEIQEVEELIDRIRRRHR